MAVKFKNKESKSYEITLIVRDYEGNPTNRTKTYTTDSSYKLWQFYMRNQGKPKKNRKNKAVKGDNIPTAQEANSILKKMYKDEDK